MLAWLAAWLKQVIAVVLLAGLIDLLLPNKAMQRYVRLVAGLIILLTIMSPIIHLLQGDFDTKLKESFEQWQHVEPGKEYKMPTLQDIETKAERLKNNQQDAAASLTEKQLAVEMRSELERAAGLRVASVRVQLEGYRQGKDPYINAVEVVLAATTAPEEKVTDDAKGQPESDKKISPAVEIEPVTPVIVQVEPVRSSDQSRDTSEAEPPDKSEASTVVTEQVADTVRAVLRQGWAVKPQSIKIQMAATDGKQAEKE